MIGAIALLMAGLLQQEAASSSSSADASCGIEFTHVPKGAEVADYYPEAAFPRKLAGTVTIDCVIAADLALTRCAVLAEAPQGYGFGDATIKYFTKNARGKSVDANDQSCIGRHAKATFHWNFT